MPLSRRLYSYCSYKNSSEKKTSRKIVVFFLASGLVFLAISVVIVADVVTVLLSPLMEHEKVTRGINPIILPEYQIHPKKSG